MCSAGGNKNSFTRKNCAAAPGTLKHGTPSNPTLEMNTSSHIDTHEQISKTLSPEVGRNSAKIQNNTVKHTTTWMDSVRGIKQKKSAIKDHRMQGSDSVDRI